jgi:hypothetical protein
MVFLTSARISKIKEFNWVFVHHCDYFFPGLTVLILISEPGPVAGMELIALSYVSHWDENEGSIEDLDLDLRAG